MSQTVTLQLTGILVLGVLAQWIAWRLRIPSILLLLVAGTLIGPVAGVIHSNRLFGKLLLPLVSLSVAVILFEGGLSLRLPELSREKLFGVFCRITTIAVVINGVIGAVAARYLVGFGWPVSAVLGAIFVVTGPNVIGPMLRHLRLRGRVASLLKWEGIVVDPIGAILAVLVFTLVRGAGGEHSLLRALQGFAATLVIGLVFGLGCAAILLLVLKRYWIPDSLHNPVSLMMVVATFVGANALHEEAGLLAVTVAGIALANQHRVPIRHVIEFKETLTVLLISCLFVTLAARLQLDDLRRLNWGSVAFVAVMILVARPLSIAAATVGSALTWRERVFLAWMAPRGIVAAAVTSVFALEFIAMGDAGAIDMVPLTFLLVFVTVLVYGLTAGRLARRFGLVHVNPQGVLFVGAHAWVRELARALHGENVPVMLVDTDWDNISAARMAGLPCQFGNALTESTRERIDFGGLGRLFAVTSNNEVNSLACLGYQEDFGRRELYQLPFAEVGRREHESIPREHRGRFLFGPVWTFARLIEAAGQTPAIRKTRLTPEFTFEAFRAEHGDRALPLVILKPGGVVQVWTTDTPNTPQPDDVIMSLTVRGGERANPAQTG